VLAYTNALVEHILELNTIGRYMTASLDGGRRVYWDVLNTLHEFTGDYDLTFAGPNPILWTAPRWQTRWDEFMSAHFMRVVTRTRLWQTNKLDKLDRVWHQTCGRNMVD
jgi:hypothetical protein